MENWNGPEEERGGKEDEREDVSHGTARGKKEIVKTGISLGPLPQISYDEAKGFHYGGLLNIYNFGDGSTYPDPKCKWYVEASAYTGGSQTYVASFDSGSILGNLRLNAAASLCRDKAMEFFGFNGLQTFYDSGMVSAFYRYDRTTINVKADISGSLAEKLRWEVGYHFNWFRINDYRSGKDDRETTLFELYRAWGIISGDAPFRCRSSAVRAGIVYDTRDYEGVPTKGLLASAHVTASPEFLGSTDSWMKVNASFRQYLPIVRERLVFAYRLDYQDFIGSAPWYVIPFYTPGGPLYDNVALGGYRTVRGVMYNRVEGPGTGFFNADMRWKFMDFTMWKQNVSFMLSGFCDGIRTFREYNLSNRTGADTDLYDKYIDQSAHDRFHISAGGAFHIVLNGNFVLSVEYARCMRRQDGGGTLYLHTGFYF